MAKPVPMPWSAGDTWLQIDSAIAIVECPRRFLQRAVHAALKGESPYVVAQTMTYGSAT